MTRTVTNRARRGEQGYLLLIVVAIIAILLIAMAIAAPKMKEQIRRDQEIELRHRGMAYAHAIKLYYKKFSTYPTNINQLVNQNNLKFLRYKYADPVTGNKVWRPVYFGQVGTGGNINPNCSTSGSSFNGNGGSLFGSGGTGASQGSSLGGSGGSSTFGSGSGLGSSADCAQTAGATGATGATKSGQSNSNGPAPGSPDAIANALAGGGGSSSGGSTNAAAAPVIGPNTVVPDPAGFLTPPSSLGSTAAGGGFGSGATSGGATFGSSTTPQAGSSGLTAGGLTGGGGQIVGVASLSHKESILTIKGKNHYNDLEFIYDPTQDFGGVAGMTGTGVGGASGNTPGSSGTNGFGAQPGGGFNTPNNGFGAPGGTPTGGTGSTGFGSTGTGGTSPSQ